MATSLKTVGGRATGEGGDRDEAEVDEGGERKDVDAMGGQSISYFEVGIMLSRNPGLPVSEISVEQLEHSF